MSISKVEELMGNRARFEALVNKTPRPVRRTVCLKLCKVLGVNKRVLSRFNATQFANFIMEKYDSPHVATKQRTVEVFVVTAMDVAPTDAAPAQVVDENRLREQITEQVLNKLGGVAVGEDVVARIQQSLEQSLAKRLETYRQVEVVVKQEDGKRVSLKRKLPKVLPAEFEIILQLSSQRVPCLMVGPAGCGKTFLASVVADALGLRFASISCSAGMSESQLAGWLLPTGKGGTFEYQPSPFVDVYENGGVFLFDEVDSSDPNTMTFLNSAIANDQFHLPQRLGNPVVKKHKDFVCLAAANTFGNGADMVYVGRNQLDGATLDRFRAGLVTMDYSEVVERAVVDPEVYEWGIAIRKQIYQHGLNRVMSTRTMLNLTQMRKAYGWGVAEFNTRYFADWNEDDRNSINIPQPKFQKTGEEA